MSVASMAWAEPRPQILALLAIWLAGFVMVAVGAWLSLTNSALVGGGCSSSSGPVVCTSGHISAEFVLGNLLSATGVIVGLVGGLNLRKFPKWWQSL